MFFSVVFVRAADWRWFEIRLSVSTQTHSGCRKSFRWSNEAMFAGIRIDWNFAIPFELDSLRVEFCILKWFTMEIRIVSLFVWFACLLVCHTRDCYIRRIYWRRVVKKTLLMDLFTLQSFLVNRIDKYCFGPKITIANYISAIVIATFFFTTVLAKF